MKCSSAQCPVNYSKDELCDCSVYTGDGTPIVVDVLGDGFTLTDAAGGVNFDLDGNGALRHGRGLRSIPMTPG